MPAYIACRPAGRDSDPWVGCVVVCQVHEIRQSFGFAHAVAHAACVEHNALHHRDERAGAARLLSVIYESHASVGFARSDLDDLLASARSRNRAFGITGMLLLEDGWFLQALEGPELLVSSLLETIRADPRHTHMRVVASERRRHRRFPDWSMAEGHVGTVESLPLAEYYEGFLAARGRDLRSNQDSLRQ